MFSPVFSVCAYIQSLQNAFGLLVQGLTDKTGGRNKTLVILFICMCVCANVHPQMYAFIFVCITWLQILKNIEEACVITRYHLQDSHYFHVENMEIPKKKESQYSWLTELLKELKCFDRQSVNLL